MAKQNKKKKQPTEKSSDKSLDKTLKENFIKVFMKARRRILKSNYQILEPVSIDLPPLTIERHTDFLTKIIDSDDILKILHVEFQSKNENAMVLRMQTYKSIIQEHYRLPVRQYVLYLGRPKATMKTKLTDLIKGETTDYQFTLESINEYNIDEFITSDIPEEVILGIFANYKGQQPEDVVRKIVKRLQTICDDETKLGKYLYQLVSTSRFANLAYVTNKLVEDMALELDINIEEDVLYKKGEARGEARGMRKKNLEIARKMLTINEPIDKIILLTGLEKAEIRQIQKEM